MLENRPQDLAPAKLPLYLELRMVVRSDNEKVPGPLKLVYSVIKCWSDSPIVYSKWPCLDTLSICQWGPLLLAGGRSRMEERHSGPETDGQNFLFY